MTVATATTLKGVIPKNPVQITNRPLSNVDADIAAVKALVQAAVNVELFTIPLYMCAMTSLYGTHPINAQGISYYKGRVWPGMATSAASSSGQLTPAQTAYNTLFSVFIDEMLHLQMAANIAGAVQVKPTFNSPLLQDQNNNWICYGPGQTVIPHIIDLMDLEGATAEDHLTVQLDALTEDQVTLFTVIEEDHKTALSRIKDSAKDSYFPAAPFADWTAQSTEVDLPKFGTIGWMYYCLWQYITIEYEGGSTLWGKLFVANTGQRDLFNSTAGGRLKEYPLLNTQITATEPLPAAAQAIYMMYAICDQGEGGIDWPTVQAFLGMIRKTAVKQGVAVSAVDSVLPVFQPDANALAQDYPSYTDTGEPAPSADAEARSSNGALDHYERFQSLAPLVGQVTTWSQWHAVPGNQWTADLLTTADYDPATASPNIPKPEEVANALNQLKATDPTMLDNVVIGAIAGITTVLTASWGDASVAFPYPSMVGSGDRMALYWAVQGSAPTLRTASAAPDSDTLQHACQGLALDGSGGSCAAPSIYHSCRGSNGCKAQGGCGFVQPTSGGGNCSTPKVGRPSVAAKAGAVGATGTCGAPTLYSAPSDNACGTLGGCAVPMSASQLYPAAGTMAIYDFEGADDTPTPIGTLDFAVGDSVYDTAWKAFGQVMAKRGTPDVGPAPAPTTLRLALPPST